MRRVNLRDYGASEALADNAVFVQTAIDDLLSGGGGTLVVSGLYKIADTVGISVAADTSCKITIESDHGARRCAGFWQTDATKVCFQLRTSVTNIRDFTMRGIALRGGSYCLDLEHDAYNLFDDCTFNTAAVAAIRSHNGGEVTSLFSRCWMTNIAGECVEGTAGEVVFSDCTFGESVGGFVLTSTRMTAIGCTVWGAAGRAPEVMGEGAALFRLNGGAGVHWQGGRVTPTCKTVFYTNLCRDVIVTGGVFVLGETVENLVANRYQHSGTKPYPILSMCPAVVSSVNESGLCMYRALGGAGALEQTHEDARFDLVAEYKGVEPFFDAVFSDPSKRNSATIRARQNQD